MTYLYIGIGGALGSLVRYILGKIISRRTESKLPIGTLIINITGALLLGIVSSLNISNNAYSLLGDGFLGAYTTFSTFMYEGFNLFHENERLNAFIYIIGSLITGVLFYFIGTKIGSFLV